MNQVRVVLDTNVLLSALLFRNSEVAWLRSSWKSGQIKPLASKTTISEFIRVLKYSKFKLNATDRDELLYEYLPYCETILVTNVVRLPNCRDVNDLPFLALAVIGNAQSLVTGDKDLLALRDETFSFSILTPAMFKAKIQEKLGSSSNVVFDRGQ